MKGGLVPLVAASLFFGVAARASPAAVEGPPAPALLRDFDFIDSLHGWVLLDAGTEIVVRRTFDGGRLWRPVPRQFGLARSSEDGGRPAERLRYADPRNGWVYRPALFSTHDGGRNWFREKLAGEVRDLAPCGGSVWAIVAVKGQQAAALLVSPVGVSSWHEPPLPPPLSGPPALVVCDGTGRVWIAAGPHEAALARSPDTGLASSSDGGRSWVSLREPCEETGVPGWLAFSRAGGLLWLACSGPDGGVTAFFRSRDGGRSWRAGNRDAHVTFSGLAAGAGGTIWITERDRPPRFSDDGGRVWRVLDGSDGFPERGSFGRVLFIDELHGWVGFSGILDLSRPLAAWVFRTTDGGRTWERQSVAGR